MSTPTVSIPLPPPEGFTIDQLADMELPSGTQLIHGGLYVNAAAMSWHNLLSARLAQALATAARGCVVLPEMAVRLSDTHAPQPDILVIERRTYREDVNSYPPELVRLAVEIMSSDRRKDQVVRPNEYAAGGIPHYWRIERTLNRELISYTYELDPVNGTYVSTGVYHTMMKVDQPWPFECDLQQLATP